MNEIKNNKTSLWIIAILVVLNIVTLSVIWTYYKKDTTEHANWQQRFSRPDRETFLRNRFGLRPEQEAEMEKLRIKHFEKLNTFRVSIHDVKMSLFEEIVKSNSDSAKIDSLTKVLGTYHLQVEREITNHFMETKRVLDTSQIREFKLLYMRALETKRPDTFRWARPHHRMPDHIRKRNKN